MDGPNECVCIYMLPVNHAPSQEEKKALKDAADEAQKDYKLATVDGRKEQVGTFFEDFFIDAFFLKRKPWDSLLGGVLKLCARTGLGFV